MGVKKKRKNQILACKLDHCFSPIMIMSSLVAPNNVVILNFRTVLFFSFNYLIIKPISFQLTTRIVKKLISLELINFFLDKVNACLKSTK